VTKKKLIRFTENHSFPHLFQPPYDEVIRSFRLKGRWNDLYFRNPNPITLEVGCGKGEYTVELASEYPDRNFIGIDIKGARLWRGCKTVQEQQMTNVAFIRSRIDFLSHLFAEAEISEIWITFPDPQPGKARKRLTSPAFLDRYRQILKPGGIVHLKTDDNPLHRYTCDVISEQALNLLYATEDLYHDDLREPASRIQTFYEQLWLEQNKPIHYLRFSFPDPEISPNKQ